MGSHFPELETKCKKTIEHLKHDLSRMRTGRASTALFEGIVVDYYGSQVPLQQLALLNAPEPRLVTIQAYDPGAVPSIEKAILASDLGLTPARDGNLIRINIPALTEERRKELIKKLHKMGEDTRVALRNNRRDAIEALKKREKAKEISEDDLRRGQEEIQKVADHYSKDVDSVLAAKEKEMMEV